jgi:PAS domain S-box-containing protein
MTDRKDDELLREVALQNAAAILQARQRAERELAAERERLRTTLASIGDAVVSTDAEGRVVFLNPVAESLTGWPQAEAAGRPLEAVLRLVNEDTRQPAENPALRAIRLGAVVGLPDRTLLVARDGAERPIEDRAAPIFDEFGRAAGAVMVFRDVAERRRAEEAHARLAALVESSDDAIISKSLDGVIRTWNAGAERLFGHTAAEAVGRPIALIIPPERWDEEREILARLRRGERVEPFETVRVAKDGRRLAISVSVSPIRDPEGRVIGASKIARDITGRKRQEEALRQSEARYRAAAEEAARAAEANAKFRAFFEQGSNFAGVLALDGTVVEANRLCLDACGFAREEVVGRPFWECGWWSPSPALVGMVRDACRVAAAGRHFRAETNYFVASGEERVVDLILAPVTGADGRALFVAATGTDVTERRRMEDSLREGDRRKDEFLALLAHELRNPLAPIRNGLQVLRLTADPAGRARALGMMDRQLTHMVRLVDDLLDVSRITRNKMQLRPDAVGLEEVVASAVETARPLIDAGGHELTVALPREPVALHADLTRLAQVFANLLTNSAKYTPPGGRIALTAERGGGELVVAVRDNGIGIPAHALPRIFDMFSQVDRTAEKNAGGLGIGLALVKGLVEMHGGTVVAESAGPDAGSTFTVRLPLAGREARDEAGAPDPKPAGSPLRVLVVDDNRDGADSMAEMLRLLGHEAHTAHDGPEGVEAAERLRPDLVLMDVGMPRLNGLDATRLIRRQPWGGGVRVVALTGWGQEGDRERSRDAGCDAHLVKPVGLSELEKLLADLARRPPRG